MASVRSNDSSLLQILIIVKSSSDIECFSDMECWYTAELGSVCKTFFVVTDFPKCWYTRVIKLTVVLPTYLASQLEHVNKYVTSDASSLGALSLNGNNELIVNLFVKMCQTRC